MGLWTTKQINKLSERAREHHPNRCREAGRLVLHFAECGKIIRVYHIGVDRDNGKENGNCYHGLYRDYGVYVGGQIHILGSVPAYFTPSTAA